MALWAIKICTCTCTCMYIVCTCMYVLYTVHVHNYLTHLHDVYMYVKITLIQFHPYMYVTPCIQCIPLIAT